jgi:hypothetical protein
VGGIFSGIKYRRITARSQFPIHKIIQQVIEESWGYVQILVEYQGAMLPVLPFTKAKKGDFAGRQGYRKGGTREMLRELARMLREQAEALKRIG